MGDAMQPAVPRERRTIPGQPKGAGNVKLWRPSKPAGPDERCKPCDWSQVEAYYGKTRKHLPPQQPPPPSAEQVEQVEEEKGCTAKGCEDAGCNEKATKTWIKARPNSEKAAFWAQKEREEALKAAAGSITDEDESANECEDEPLLAPPAAAAPPRTALGRLPIRPWRPNGMPGEDIKCAPCEPELRFLYDETVQMNEERMIMCPFDILLEANDALAEAFEAADPDTQAQLRACWEAEDLRALRRLIGAEDECEDEACGMCGEDENAMCQDAGCAMCGSDDDDDDDDDLPELAAADASAPEAFDI
eukprot:TRINITY_DN339_c2_g1_i1.p1 TRINITY_DN339_c2_g1~~TRINITY_DN339_c2_g1_i1.p1  ORF type:complete len:305 (+),score=113.64 TRINITY_DN339_c2_g1_i1:40-954(+)